MTTAAKDPARESEMKAKYTNWMKLPNMSSPGKTIEFIRTNELTKR